MQCSTLHDTMKSHYFVLFLCAIAMGDDTNVDEVFHLGSNKFTANMFSEVAKLNSGKSFILSAFSVMTPLAQLALASVGPSHDDLLNSMGLPNDNVTKSIFSRVVSRLGSLEGVELKTASRVYIPLESALNPEFAAVSRDVFNSEVKNVNFLKNVETAREINTWVEDKTNNRINDLVSPDSFSAATRAVLVNAIYFKGTWISTFAKSLTYDRDFHVTKEQVVKVPMMYNKADYKYRECDRLNSKIIELPYAGEQTSMVIILPNEVDGIADLIEKLKDLSVLDEEIEHLEKDEVEVIIPKFKIETTTDLKEVLSKMNVNKIFTTEARLDKLLKTSENLYVDSAIQKAFIEVNEEGTEAAASNVFGISYVSSINYARRFVADHPFVFLLKERNNILFSGLYYA